MSDVGWKWLCIGDICDFLPVAHNGGKWLLEKWTKHRWENGEDCGKETEAEGNSS